MTSRYGQTPRQRPQEFGITTDERRDRRPNVADTSSQRPQRRKVRAQARRTNLEDADRLGHIAQLVLTQIDEFHSAKKSTVESATRIWPP